MVSSTPIDIPIRIEDLAGYYINLASTLTETGINGNQLNQIVTSSLHTSCSRCNISLTGEEVQQLTLVDDAAQLSHPKLKRLRLGYCAREGCESADYRIHLEPFTGVDWEALIVKANQLISSQKAAATDAQRRQVRQKKIQRSKRFAFGVFLCILTVLLLFYWWNGRLPFIMKARKYQVDPASVTRFPRP